MSDKPKRMLLAKGHCPTCQSPVSVEIEEPAPIIQVTKEPCKCGKTETERCARWVALGVMALFLCFLGCCSVKNYFTTQQIKIMTGKYEVHPAGVNDKPFFNEPDFVVEPKPDQKK